MNCGLGIIIPDCKEACIDALPVFSVTQPGIPIAGVELFYSLFQNNWQNKLGLSESVNEVVFLYKSFQVFGGGGGKGLYNHENIVPSNLTKWHSARMCCIPCEFLKRHTMFTCNLLQNLVSPLLQCTLP